MRRILLSAALVAGSFAGFGGTANAICVSGLACAGQSSCTGLANVCPSADECGGTVNVCPGAEYCWGGVNVCDLRVATAK